MNNLKEILNGKTAKDSHGRSRIACLIGFGTLVATLHPTKELLTSSGGKVALIIALEAGRQFGNRIFRDLKNTKGKR